MVFSLFAVLTAVLGALPANALTAGEAEKVVAILEQLQPATGKVAYDEEEAADIFEQDSTDQALIEKAGFSQESWKTAFDAVLKGFMASISDAEINALFAKLSARVEAGAGTVTPEQAQAIRDMIDENLQQIQQYRQEGRQWAAFVLPLQSRLRQIVPMEVEE
jgi:uncharacterized protein with beta-barrel porin domain